MNRMPWFWPNISTSTHVVLVDCGPGSFTIRKPDLYRDASIPCELAEEVSRRLDCRCCHRRGWWWAAGRKCLTSRERDRVTTNEEWMGYDLNATRHGRRGGN